MTETPIHPAYQPVGSKPNGFQELLSRFWGFDRLIGSALVKFVYYVGLVGIVLLLILGLFRGFNMMRYSASMGLGAIVLAILFAIAAVVIWRFVCEIYLLFFQMYNRMGEIRDRLPPPS